MGNRKQTMIAFILGFVFVTACGSSPSSPPTSSPTAPPPTSIVTISAPTDPPPTVTPTPIPPTPTALPTITTKETPVGVGVRTLELTFQGDSCSYEGPTELLPGPVELIFYNNAEEMAAVNFLKLLEGKTIQDVIEYSGEEPSTKHAPAWSQELGTFMPIQSGETYKWEYNLEEGNYLLVCVDLWVFGVWIGTGFTVTK